MVGESGVAMMPFHHDSGERVAMAVALRVCLWDVVRNLGCCASVCDESISAGKWGELSDRYARTRGACMLSSWPERARVRYEVPVNGTPASWVY